MIFRASGCATWCSLAASSNSRIHIRDQANPQYMIDMARDKLTGKTADDQVVF
jgi:hypothetical protein